MSVWSVLALCAFVQSTIFTVGASASDGSDIPYANGRGQIYSSSADLISAFRAQKPTAPELPAVIPGRKAVRSAKTPGTPPRPVFRRSMRLRDELTVPGSDFTEVFDIEFHAESNTARTTVDNSTTTYTLPAGDGKVQYLKIVVDATSGSPVRRCVKSPALPTSGADNFPALPNLEPFQFVGHKTDEGQQVEHWQHVVAGKPGEGGAAKGESLTFKHDFIVYRDGDDAVPLRYTVTTDSSVLGPASDSYTHRYSLLPPPSSPLLPDVSKLCDEVKDYRTVLASLAG